MTQFRGPSHIVVVQGNVFVAPLCPLALLEPALALTLSVHVPV